MPGRDDAARTHRCRTRMPPLRPSASCERLHHPPHEFARIERLLQHAQCTEPSASSSRRALGCAVTKMIGTSQHPARSTASNSMPDIPAIWISHTMQCDDPLARVRETPRPMRTASRAHPSSARATPATLIANSSSMMQTVLSCTGVSRGATLAGRAGNATGFRTAYRPPCVGNHAEVWCRRYRPYRSRVTIRPRWRTGPVRLPRHGSSCPSCTERCGRAPRPIHAIARLDRRTGQHAARRRSRGHAMPQLFAEMPEPRVAPAHADSRIRQNLDDPDPRSRRRGGLACAVITLAAHAGASRSRPACRRAHPPFSTDPAGASARVRTHRRLQTLAASSLPFLALNALVRSRNRPLHRRIANITASRSPAPRTSLTLESSLGNGFPRSIRPWSMLSHTKVRPSRRRACGRGHGKQHTTDLFYSCHYIEVGRHASFVVPMLHFRSSGFAHRTSLSEHSIPMSMSAALTLGPPSGPHPEESGSSCRHRYRS